MKFYNKLGITFMLSLSILPMGLGITQVNASDNNNQPTQQNSNSWDNADNWNSTQIANFFNSGRSQDSNSNIQNHYNGINGPNGTVNVQNNGDTVVNISDASLVQYLHNQYGINYPDMNKSDGKTTIVFHGKKTKGNFDLYVSQDALNLTHGIKSIKDFYSMLYNIFDVNIPDVVSNGSSLYSEIKAASNTYNGKVFIVRHWDVTSTHNQ